MSSRPARQRRTDEYAQAPAPDDFDQRPPGERPRPVAPRSRTTYALNPADLLAIHGPKSRQHVMFRAAMNLIVPGQTWELDGRGPDAFDDVGFVRACAQTAALWDPQSQSIVQGAYPILQDVAPRREGAIGSVTLQTMADLAEAWGLKQIGEDQRRPGDLIVMADSRCVAAILIEAADPVRQPGHEKIACAMRGRAPAIIRRVDLTSVQTLYYRWPGEE